MCNHTECVNNPSGAIRHQQFYSPCFSWALGIPAMWCLRIASGVVVGQPGQLGIVQLTIASLPVPFGKQGTHTVPLSGSLAIAITLGP